MPELICKILHISKTTYYSYRKKGYPIIKLLSSFKKEELIELLETGKIEKQDRLKELLEIEKKYNQIVGIVDSKSQQNMQ